MADKPIAFVIMPFDAELNEVYSAFIVPALEEAGYSVRRADNLDGQKNILRDIVEWISKSDLILADLTGLNPNVFYELGMAHALLRPVILMTQNIDELPFDLRSYRVITYNTHFARIASAREALRQTAFGAIRGELEWGNPVSDFASTGRLISRTPASPSESSAQAEDEDEEDRGWLDHRVAMEEGFGELREILSSVTEATLSIGEKTNSYTERFIQANAQASGRASGIKYIANEYSRELEGFGEKLSVANDLYERIARDTQNSIEFIISNATINSVEDAKALLEFVETLDGVEKAAGGALDGYVGMRQSLKSVEGIESAMTRAAKIVGREVDRFISNIEKTTASVQRGIEIGRRRLEEANVELGAEGRSQSTGKEDATINSAMQGSPLLE
jgi:hypothetical protein